MQKAVIVEPEQPENTGFIARLAANYQIDLRIVKPKFNLEEARKTAKNAQEKLRNAEIFENVEKAVENLEYVVGTKPGKGTELEKFQPRKNTSVMIGRESSGLKNKELKLCDAIVHLNPPGYSSLNQSHAAAILFHELQNQEEGMENQQKQHLKQITSGIHQKLLLRSNPSRGELEKLLGELHGN